MPQSNNQTSPRLGGTFLPVVHGGQMVAGSSGYIIRKWARIPRRQVMNDFPNKLLLFLNPQILELGKQFWSGSHVTCRHNVYSCEPPTSLGLCALDQTLGWRLGPKPVTAAYVKLNVYG